MSALTREAASIDRGRLAGLLERELDRFRAEHPRSLELHERSQGSLLFGVPMSWMARWAGGFPVYLDEAKGARVTDADGHEYVDLCLGDTGAMAGHAPQPVVRGDRDRRPSAGSPRCSRPRTRPGSERSWLAASAFRSGCSP